MSEGLGGVRSFKRAKRYIKNNRQGGVRFVKAEGSQSQRSDRSSELERYIKYYFTTLHMGVLMTQKKELKEDDRISFIGNRDIWQDFVYKVKKNKKKVWQELEPILENYINSN